ncbi:MAG: GlsB/YeaQ/YmgE family stress response membrane protein [Myxococcota bacterium]|nr:GlsB/YeaQ/YmgE family stress response membrane protein [Myxococcota bacterium]
MTLTGVIVLLVIAGVCGSLGSGLAGYSHLGCLSSIALGFVGAWLGVWVARQLHLPALFVLHIQNESFPVIWSIVGAAVFAALMSLLARRNPGF